MTFLPVSVAFRMQRRGARDSEQQCTSVRKREELRMLHHFGSGEGETDKHGKGWVERGNRERKGLEPYRERVKATP